jgi:hypothetical protein
LGASKRRSAQHHRDGPQRLETPTRRCFTMARTLGPVGAPDVTMAWARMELAAVHPETAPDMLDRARTAVAMENSAVPRPDRHIVLQGS